MTDVHEPEVRSYNMKQIKGKDTKPEMLVRKFLFANGFRYRVHEKDLPGKPDIVLKKYGTIIFIHGCFWHGHTHCKYFKIPRTRSNWWKDKIMRNKKNDKIFARKLRKMNWNVLIIWECEIKKDKREETFNDLLLSLHREFSNPH